MHPSPRHLDIGAARAFTVVELLIAVAVLVIVILASARIFSTASAIASYGEANSNIQQTAASVERVIRRDVARMSPEGYLIIQCVAVRNDINRTSVWSSASGFGGSAIAPLLDSTRAPEAIIRCDRLVFFTSGFDQTARFVGSGFVNEVASGSPGVEEIWGGNQQALASRIYIGPGVQMPGLRSGSNGVAVDPSILDFGSNALPLVPWAFDAPPLPNLETTYWASTSPGAPQTFGNQPEARRWALARQATLLGDDGGAKRYFQTDNSYGPNSAPALWSNQWPSPQFTAAQDDSLIYQGFIPAGNLYPNSWLAAGRVDIAASHLNDVRRTAQFSATNQMLPWISTSSENQWQRIRNMTFGPSGLFGWPRVEKVAPSMKRVDELLSTNMLAGNCSSIEIDWTWRSGTGRREAARGSLQTARIDWNPPVNTSPIRGLAGFVTDPAAGQVWFGLPDGFRSASAMPQGGDIVMPQSQWRGVTSLMGPSPNAGVTPEDNRYDLPVYLGANVFDKGTNQWTQFNGSTLRDPNGGNFEAAVVGPPILPANIEGVSGIVRPLGNSMPVWVYTAVFGFNGKEPLLETFDGTKIFREDYTPWPKALRFTLRMHDPRLTVDSGRTVQFVVDLPRQTQE